MAERTPLVVVGDALLDRDLTGSADRLAPDAPVPVVRDCAERVRPGGAALAAWLAARDGRDVTLITALGDDPAARELRALLDPWLTLIALPSTGTLPEKTRVLARAHPVVRLDRGGGRARAATDEARAALRSAPAVLVSDYGRGTADALRDVLAARPPLVWDPHPRGGAPVPGTRLVTPAEQEAHGFAPPEGRPGSGLGAAAHSAAALVRNWRVAAVAVTLGPRGALLSYGEHPLLVPAPDAHPGDSCGAGDRFAATAAGLLADGALVGEAVEAAVGAATAFVAAGGASALPDAGRGPVRVLPEAGRGPVRAASGAGRGPVRAVSGAGRGPVDVGSGTGWGAGDVVSGAGDGPVADPRGGRGSVAARPGVRCGPDAPESGFEDPRVLADRVRAQHGTVVAAGGCFDLLHAGHVGLLQAARRLGDCLVVCVNSDASVRRRKGDGRPVNPLADRVRVLRALACVDAVAVFDEDTPERLLGDLRPDVWVKGGDYAGADLPEAGLLAEWGGQAVLLPYLDGRSSTALLARAAERAR
ncbi:D-glycero-beta-D-manno-heptose 1-phosphate adenylyltransferase [Streptomyces ziwulingensis]|uniref:D-glycero-beta-D-manno-heptose 1-phosphate adenylyltransferase n=1 Tax=Streptomyces ziwulingensis TaxID=1045501 RepID=A0ABP9CQJ8_9ACTN